LRSVHFSALSNFCIPQIAVAFIILPRQSA